MSETVMHMNFEGSPYDIGAQATTKLLGPVFTGIYQQITDPVHREHAALGAWAALLATMASFNGHEVALRSMGAVLDGAKGIDPTNFDPLHKAGKAMLQSELQKKAPQPSEDELAHNAATVIGAGLSEEEKRRVAAEVMAAGLADKPGTLIQDDRAIFTGSPHDIATQMHQARFYDAMEGAVNNMPPETHHDMLRGFLACAVTHFIGPGRTMTIADAATALREIASAIEVAGAGLETPRH